MAPIVQGSQQKRAMVRAPHISTFGAKVDHDDSLLPAMSKTPKNLGDPNASLPLERKDRPLHSKPMGNPTCLPRSRTKSRPPQRHTPTKSSSKIARSLQSLANHNISSPNKVRLLEVGWDCPARPTTRRSFHSSSFPDKGCHMKLRTKKQRGYGGTWCPSMP